MSKVGLRFAFDEPKGWNEFQDGTRHVYQGSAGAELIVSASLTTGGGTDEERDRAEQSSFGRATEAAVETASDPALVVLQGLTRTAVRPPLEIWTIDSVTKAQPAMRFLQAIARGPGGVMFITYECPESEGALPWFKAFLDTVRLVEPNSRA